MSAPTRRHASRFAWLVENATARNLPPGAEARAMPAASAPVPGPTQFTTPPPNKAVKVEANTALRDRFGHLKALSTTATPVISPVAAQQPRREAATQPRNEAAAIVARFAKVARIASGEEPAPAAHKPPAEAAAMIKRMTSLYDKFKGAN